MDKARVEKFHILLERMVDSMAFPDVFKREELVEVLNDVCKLFNLSKGVTEYYDGIWSENSGQGERLVDYDDGREGRVVLYRRAITPNQTVIKSTLYMPVDAPDLPDDEKEKLDIMLRLLLAFISRNRLQSTVEQLAYYDRNGYPNLNSFSRYLEKINDEGSFYGYTAIMFNLRGFSLINRDIGMEAGDIVIRRYFEIVSETVGDKGIVCRMGGDNFITIFKNEILERILDIIRGYPVVYDEKREKRVMISACAGVFTVPEDFVYDRPGKVIGLAFQAAHEAKLENNGIIIFTDGKESVEKENVKRIRRMFPEGLRNNEFYAYYQPKVDISTGKIVGAEALCRWKKDGKFLMPAEFIPVLEQNTDICRLDFRILEIVCRDIRRWLDEGRSVVRISINLSRKHLIDIDLVKHLLKIVDEYEVPHEYIEFELTETTTDEGLKNLKRIVEELHLQGIATTVDDFGMGYSSLSLIREIPWDVLKLDKGFLPTDENDEESITALMYRHVASMAQDMKLECVTEGVETIGQLNILKKNNCRIAQGFYFDRPLPVEEFEVKMKTGYPELAIDMCDHAAQPEGWQIAKL